MKKIPLFLFYLCLTLSVFGQRADPNANHIEFDIKKTLPTSPEAAMLGKFGDIPIGYYTGTANISIPLYTIKSGDVSIPITLNYHNSGVKVEDEATWVGLGWSLDPEGAIIKIINGTDDAGDGLATMDPTGYNYLFGRSITGVYSQVPDVGTSTWSCDGQGMGSSGPTIDSAPILSSIALGNGQPDIYQFSFPGGYSGKFYISPRTQLPVLVDKKDSLLIRPYTGGWAIKTLNGDQYIFTSQEVAYTDNFYNYAGYTWKLTKIFLNNGKTVDFSYTSGGYAGLSYSETYHDPYPYQPIIANDYGVVPHTASPQSTTQILTQIKTDNVIVNFNAEDRLDIAPGGNPGGTPYSPKRLKSIDIVNASTSQPLKSFNFSYDYFTSSADTSFTFYKSTSATLPTTLTSRLKLNSVTEVGYTSTGQAIQNPQYKFTYNTTVNLPSKVSFSRDFWGYYNGVSNRLLLPNLYYFYYSDFDSYKDVPTSTLNAFKGANRTVDVNNIMTGMLTSIKYPTGGYTTFAYQPNDFSNYSYPDITTVSSNTVSISVLDQNNANNQKSASFTLSADQTLQFSNYIQSGPPNAAITFDGLLASTITLSGTINGTTTQVKQWKMSTDQRQQFATNGNVMTWINDPVALKANVLYTIAVELPDALGPQNSAMSQASVSSIFKYVSPATNVPKITYGGGVRVSEIDNYDNTGAFVNKKSIKYINSDGTSSGKLMSHLQFLYSRNLLCTQEIGSPNVGGVGIFQFNAALQNTYFISSQSAVPYSNSAGGNLVGYSRVEEINVGADGSTNGKHVYYYHNNPDQTKVNCPNIPDLANGLITEEDFLNSNGDMLKTVNNLYTDNNSIINPQGNSYTGVKIFNNFIGPDPCYRFTTPVNGAVNYSSSTMPTKYEIDFYPINSAWNLLSSKTTKDFNAGNAITITEAYTYNKLGQLVSENTVNSRGETLATNNVYPDDMPRGTNAIAQALVDSSFYDDILEQHRLTNNVEVSQSKSNYAIINNQLVQSEIGRSYNGNSFFVDATFDRYGPNKTIRQVTQKGSPVVLLWSFHNTYPIAEIKNTTYDAVETALGGASVVNNFGSEVPTKSRIDGFLAAIKSVLPNAQITSYTYDPLIGLTSMTDAKGMPTYYEYDSFQRLMNIKDKDGNIVKHYCYNYAGQTSGCNILAPVQVYQSVDASKSFMASPLDGYQSISVTYPMPAGKYTSTVSQADADQKAIDDVNANGQAYADAHGHLKIYRSALKADSIMAVCNVGYQASKIFFSVPEGKFTSVTSQQDADGQANDYFTTQGQQQANSTACTKIYTSAAISQPFTKNDCPGRPGMGTSVTYNVAANAYNSIVSQADADNKAQNDVNANGQNYANANGSCIPYISGSANSNGTDSVPFTVNNSSPGDVITWSLSSSIMKIASGQGALTVYVNQSGLTGTLPYSYTITVSLRSTNGQVRTATFITSVTPCKNCGL